MTETIEDVGVLLALLQRLETQRLPRLLDLKKKVDAGNNLDELEVEYLQELINDSKQIKPLLAKHPEYTSLVGRVSQLVNQITEKGLENEKSTTLSR